MTETEHKVPVQELYKLHSIDAPGKLLKYLTDRDVEIPPLFQRIFDAAASPHEGTNNIEALLETPEYEADLDTNLNCSRDYTALILACRYDLRDVVKYLVDAGADVTKTTRNALSPLLVCIQEGNLGLAEFLLEHGVVVSISAENDPTQRNEKKKIQSESSPIHVACWYGHLPIVQLLVERLESKTCSWDSCGLTPLMVSLVNEKWDVARYLLNAFNENEDDDCKEADYVTKLALNHKSWEGETALTICMRKYHTSSEVNDLVKRMILCGANPHIPNVHGESPDSPLSLALQQNAPYEFVKFMIDQSSPPTESLQFGAVALALKHALRKDKKFVHLLLKRVHANPNFLYDSKSKDTSMHELGRILRDHEWTDHDYEVEMIRLLLNFGGELKTPNARGETFMSLVSRRRDLKKHLKPKGNRNPKQENKPPQSQPSPVKERTGGTESKGSKKNAKNGKNGKKAKSGKENSGKQRQQDKRQSPVVSNKSKRKKGPKKKARQPKVVEEENTNTETNELATIDVPEQEQQPSPPSVEPQTPQILELLDPNSDEIDGFTTVQSRSKRRNRKAKSATASRKKPSARDKKRTPRKHETPRKNARSVASSPAPKSLRDNNAKSRSKDSGRKPLFYAKNPKQRKPQRRETPHVEPRNAPVRPLPNHWKMTSPNTGGPKTPVPISNADQTKNEPREKPLRGMSAMENSAEFPAPFIEAGLLSPRANSPPPRSPNLEAHQRKSVSPLSNANRPNPSPRPFSKKEEDDEKSSSESLTLPSKPILQERRTEPSLPSRPPKTSSRPIKPPKFNSRPPITFDMYPDTSKFLSNPPSSHTNGVKNPQPAIESDTGTSSKSGNSTENVASGQSSPTSQSISIAIQTDRVPSPLLEPNVTSPMQGHELHHAVSESRELPQPLQQIQPIAQPMSQPITTFSHLTMPHEQPFPENTMKLDQVNPQQIPLQPVQQIPFIPMLGGYPPILNPQFVQTIPQAPVGPSGMPLYQSIQYQFPQMGPGAGPLPYPLPMAPNIITQSQFVPGMPLPHDMQPMSMQHHPPQLHQPPMQPEFVGQQAFHPQPYHPAERPQHQLPHRGPTLRPSAHQQRMQQQRQ